MLYEMLTGLPPFYDENTNDMYRKILSEPLHFPGPEIVPPAARDLLTKLLDRDATKRLGVNGASEIKAHPFFHSIDWRKLLDRKYEPGFKPNVVCTAAQKVNGLLLTHLSRLMKGIPQTLTVNSHLRRLPTHTWTDPCFRRRCSSNSLAGHTTVLSKASAMQVGASETLPTSTAHEIAAGPVAFSYIRTNEESISMNESFSTLSPLEPFV